MVYFHLFIILAELLTPSLIIFSCWYSEQRLKHDVFYNCNFAAHALETICKNLELFLFSISASVPTFHEWKKHFDVSYDSYGEEVYHKNVWENNLQTLGEFSLHPFSDKEPEQAQVLLSEANPLGLQHDRDEHLYPKNMDLSANLDVPVCLAILPKNGTSQTFKNVLSNDQDNQEG